MTEPREVIVTLADARTLTALETARALATVGIPQRQAATMLRFLDVSRGPTAAELLAATELLYAIAWQLERRRDRALTWDDAQTWRVVLDLESGVDPVAEAEAIASVDAAIVTGLPPAVAGELTVAQLEEYRHIAAERDKRARRRRA